MSLALEFFHPSSPSELEGKTWKLPTVLGKAAGVAGAECDTCSGMEQV